MPCNTVGAMVAAEHTARALLGILDRSGRLNDRGNTD